MIQWVRTKNYFKKNTFTYNLPLLISKHWQGTNPRNKCWWAPRPPTTLAQTPQECTQRWRWCDKYLLPQILADYGAFCGIRHITSLEKLLRNCLVIWVRPRFKFSIAWIQGSPHKVLLEPLWKCESAFKAPWSMEMGHLHSSDLINLFFM